MRDVVDPVLGEELLRYVPRRVLDHLVDPVQASGPRHHGRETNGPLAVADRLVALLRVEDGVRLVLEDELVGADADEEVDLGKEELGLRGGRQRGVPAALIFGAHLAKLQLGRGRLSWSRP
jgi:hypothetical protein